APRGKTKEEDQRIIETLKNSPKEISENVMIVDLVRNDLTRSAQEGTVKAERQLEVQTFEQVHQLVSTITCQKRAYISDIQSDRKIRKSTGGHNNRTRTSIGIHHHLPTDSLYIDYKSYP